MPNKTAREKLNKLVAKRKKLNARTTAGKKTILGNLRKKRIQNKINKNTAAISDAKKPKVTKPVVTKPKVTKPKVGDEYGMDEVKVTTKTKSKPTTKRPTGGRGGGKPKPTRKGR